MDDTRKEHLDRKKGPKKEPPTNIYVPTDDVENTNGTN